MRARALPLDYTGGMANRAVLRYRRGADERTGERRLVARTVVTADRRLPPGGLPVCERTSLNNK